MVLLMVLAVLTLLCLMGLMFVMMANMERATARAYLDMVRAKMIAQSGIHAAMVNTRSLLTEKGFNIKELEYHGEDLDGDGNEVPTLGLITPDSRLCEDQDNDGIVQRADCPLYRAVHPSFMTDISGPAGQPDGVLNAYDLIQIKDQADPKWVGVSGIMPGPYNPQMGAYYSVKVEDLSGKIDINYVFPEWRTDKDPEYDMFRSVLGNLTQELFGNPNIGRNLAAAAPFATMDEIRTKLAGLPYNIEFSEAEFDQLKACITTYAWRDTAVIKPVDLKGRLNDESNAPVFSGDDVFTWRSIRPLSIGYPMATDYSGVKRLVGRAPVNINTAPEPVLIALIKDLTGLYLDPTVGFEVIAHSGQFPSIAYSYNPADSDANKGMLGRLLTTAPISQPQAQAIARAIMVNREMKPTAAELAQYPWRGLFRSWQQFNSFCDNVLYDDILKDDPATSVDEGRVMADVLKANFNPNTNLTELNPPYQRLFWVGKDNLVGYKDAKGQLVPGRSFEFSFFPTGYFLITSLGRLLSAESDQSVYKIMAEAEIEATVQLFNLYRETSQKDFLEDFWGHGARIDEVISQPTGFTNQTTTDNLTLQTYPEVLEYASTGTRYCRHPDLGQSEHLQNPYVQDAHYDGYITLATVENSDTAPAPNFRASYNEKGLNADVAPTIPQGGLASNPPGECQPDAFGPYRNRLIAPDNLTSTECNTLRGFISGKPGAGTLFPDGVYSELDNVPIYNYRPPDIDNFTVSMWLKPIFFPEYSAKTRVYLTYQVWGVPSYGPTAPLGIYNIANRNYGISPINNGEDWSASGYGDTYAQAWDHTAFLGGGFRTTSQVEASAEVSPCLNHRLCSPQGNHLDYPLREGTYWGDTIFRAGKWMYLGWIHGGVPEDIFHAGTFTPDILCINGKWVEDSFFRSKATSAGEVLLALPENILRLGERRSAEALNSAPDATLDEVLIWANKNCDNGGPQITQDIWQQGRYYRGDKGVFISRTINLAQKMGLPTETPITVFMVNWTQYAPEEKWSNNGNRLALPQPGEPAPTCEIEILNEAKNLIGLRQSHPDSPSDRPKTIQPDPSGELIGDTYIGDKLVVTYPIRYRVKFLPNVHHLNDILVDPLIFDDITIIYYSVPKFLSWAYRR